MTLTATFSLSASGSQTKDDGLAVVTDSFSSGGATFPSLSANFLDGTNAGQANKSYRVQQSIAANTTVHFDLTNSLVDAFGVILNFTKIKCVLVAIVSPDGSKKLRIGPMGETNAWQGPFGGVGAESYLETGNWLHLCDPLGAGWDVTLGTADHLPIRNPTASSLDFVIWILGN